MKKRVHQNTFPDFSVVDLKESKKENLPFWISQTLYDSLKQNLSHGLQSALFLNRRGMAPFVICHSCATLSECPNCSISLTLHGSSYLVCHYCSYREAYTTSCLHCKEGEVKPYGIGTEKIEEDLGLLFPTARIGRADRDEIQSREDIETLISQIEKREIDILIGTQMIAKGLDFPHLSLVGLVNADLGLNLPDFRSTERTFQLITQVSGRAGRSIENRGKIILQTMNPNHPIIELALKNDFESFAQMELEGRRELLYPPFIKLVRLRIEGATKESVQSAAHQVKQKALLLLQGPFKSQNIQILGPVQPPIGKINNRHRMHMLIKSPLSNSLEKFMTAWIQQNPTSIKKIKFIIDRDPLNLL